MERNDFVEGVLFEDLNLPAFDRVYVNSSSYSLRFVPSDFFGVSVTHRGQVDTGDNPISVTVEDGVLRVGGSSTTTTSRRERQLRIFSIGFFGSSERTMQIYVPRDALAHIEIKASSGIVRVEDVNFTTISAQASSGSVTIAGNARFAESVDVQVSSGAVRLENLDAENIDVRVTSGAIHANRLTMTEGTFRTNSGAIVANRLTMTDGTFRTTSGAVRLDDITAHTLEAHANSGNVTVEGARIQPSDADDWGRVNLSVTSGSIRFDTHTSRNVFDYDMSVSAGSINIDGSRASGRSASNTRTAGGAHTLTARASSGNIRVNFGQ